MIKNNNTDRPRKKTLDRPNPKKNNKSESNRHLNWKCVVAQLTMSDKTDPQIKYPTMIYINREKK